MHEDVSDLRDVVDAINRLCDTMKTGEVYDEVSDDPIDCFPDATNPFDDGPCPVESGAFAESSGAFIESSGVFIESSDAFVASSDAFVASSDTFVTSPDAFVASSDAVVASSDAFVASYAEPTDVVDVASIVSPEDVEIRTVDPSERWSDSLMSIHFETSDVEPMVPCEPASEMYYTASSEVSLLSDTEVPERVTVDEESLDGKETKDDRKECVIAGHVAAMRERFESMTRTNTPCPDLMRSTSPSFDVFRNITPSPDRLG